MLRAINNHWLYANHSSDPVANWTMPVRAKKPNSSSKRYRCYVLCFVNALPPLPTASVSNESALRVRERVLVVRI